MSNNTITNPNTDYSAWYNDVIQAADMAEHSPVRGCMIIKPYGYAIWELIQSHLDKKFKETGHTNAYFPLFIPKSFFSKEATHVDGFAKECAVVTHYRLKNNPNGEGIVVDDEAKLEEELIVRPTSETIIWHTYKDWIKSYRDLPLLINQWANVVRWEMRTRPFLRTTEFLWQEGHTAHATEQEAIEEAKKMNHVYADFVEQQMAIPVIRGRKSPSERFAGAMETYCIEAMMRDGKALQAGTSHFLGQNFAKAFDVKFLNQKNELSFVWATSWGVSTRLIGALIMAHGDEKGLMLPPRIAPIQLVIIPIYKGEDTLNTLNQYAQRLAQDLQNGGIRVKIDTDTVARPGWKYAEYELKGVPLRIAFGGRDIDNQQVELVRRDTGEKQAVPISGITSVVQELLDTMQNHIFKRALQFQQDNTHEVNSFDEFEKVLQEKGGFILAYWDGTAETEQKIKEKTKATIRCIPSMDDDIRLPKLQGKKCVYSGKEAKYQVLFAIAY